MTLEEGQARCQMACRGNLMTLHSARGSNVPLVPGRSGTTLKPWSDWVLQRSTTRLPLFSLVCENLPQSFATPVPMSSFALQHCSQLLTLFLFTRTDKTT
jgi:hypothetical protein